MDISIFCITAITAPVECLTLIHVIGRALFEATVKALSECTNFQLLHYFRYE